MVPIMLKVKPVTYYYSHGRFGLSTLATQVSSLLISLLEREAIIYIHPRQMTSVAVTTPLLILNIVVDRPGFPTATIRLTSRRTAPVISIPVACTPASKLTLRRTAPVVSVPVA